MPKTVKLTKPLLGGKVTEFTFRDPRFDDYMLIGDPRAPIISGERVYMRAIPEAVRDYAERLLDKEGDPGVMAHCSLKDTKAIEKVILGFFHDADSVPEEETKTTTSSSSDAG